MNEDKIREIIEDVVFRSHTSISKVQSQQYQELNHSLNGYGRVYKFLKTDIGFIVGFVTFILSIVTPYFALKTDIAIIKNDFDNLSGSLDAYVNSR